MRQRPESYEDRLQRVVLQPLSSTGNGYRLLVFVLGDLPIASYSFGVGA